MAHEVRQETYKGEAGKGGRVGREGKGWVEGMEEGLCARKSTNSRFVCPPCY
jgi:hypothetical protein